MPNPDSKSGGSGQPASAGIAQDSLFNPRGQGNASGADPLWQSVPGGDDGNPRLDPAGLPGDPDSVMRRNTGAGVSQEIRHIVANHVGAPRTAEAVAGKLAELYGPFAAANSQENREAILRNLLWIADTSAGIRYGHPGSDTSTQSPNETLSTRLGICRDIHCATNALLASLLNAALEGGRWKPGSPDGQDDNVQTIAFNTPSEFHAYMVYRDPATGGWNAFEYDKLYRLNAPDPIDACRALPGYIPGYTRFQIKGWDGQPETNVHGLVGARNAVAFFEKDPGVGKAGQVSLSGGAAAVQAIGFASERTSIVGEVAPGTLASAFRGGIKVNFHRDFQDLDRQGHLRVAGGIYSEAFDASQWTGDRSAADRARYRTYVLAVQADGAIDSKQLELAQKHLVAQWGAEFGARLGLPVGTGAGLFAFMPGAVQDYSKLTAAAEGSLSGHEQLNPHLGLDWKVQLRGKVDAINAGAELATGGTADRSLLKDPLRADFGLVLTYKTDAGLVTRFEAGGTQLLFAPADKGVVPSGEHHAMLTLSPQSGIVDFGIFAEGSNLDGKLIAVDSLRVALKIDPTPNVSLGLGASASLPGGDWSKLGDRLQVSGNLAIRF